MFRSVSMSSTGSSMTGLRYCVVQFCSGPSVVPTPCESREFVDDGALVIRAEMAGLDPDKDVEVSVEADVLHIAAERREEEKVEGHDYVRREMHYGSFRRDLPLPKGASKNDVKATYKDGILEVRLPMATAGAETATRIAVMKS